MAETLSESILNSLKNKRSVALLVVVAVVVGGIAAFAESISKLVDIWSAVAGGHATAVVIPNDTGWIFGGYYEEASKNFIQGPYFKVIRSNYPAKQVLPRDGEWIRITAERNIVIADFATMGLTKQFEPPWQQNVLRSGDYTGWKLPKGATVEVRDVSAGSFPGHPDAVWIRVGAAR